MSQKIVSHPSNDKYRDGWDRIFGGIIQKKKLDAMLNGREGFIPSADSDLIAENDDYFGLDEDDVQCLKCGHVAKDTAWGPDDNLWVCPNCGVVTDGGEVVVVHNELQR